MVRVPTSGLLIPEVDGRRLMVLSDGQHHRAIVGAGNECLLFDSLGDTRYVTRSLIPKLREANPLCSFRVLDFCPQLADRNCGVWVCWVAMRLMEFQPGGQYSLEAHIRTSAARQGLSCIVHHTPSPQQVAANLAFILSLKLNLRETLIPRESNPSIALDAEARRWEEANAADRIHFPTGVHIDLTADYPNLHPAPPPNSGLLTSQ